MGWQAARALRGLPDGAHLRDGGWHRLHRHVQRLRAAHARPRPYQYPRAVSGDPGLAPRRQHGPRALPQLERLHDVVTPGTELRARKELNDSDSIELPWCFAFEHLPFAARTDNTQQLGDGALYDAPKNMSCLAV